MKKIFSTCFLMLLIFSSCLKDEGVTNNNQEVIANRIANNLNPDGPGDPGSIDCSTYKARVNKNGIIPAKIYNINYSLSLTVDQIECIRQSYFERFTCLYMSVDQDEDNTHTDKWDLIPCDPNGEEEIDESIDEDDRVED